MRRWTCALTAAGLALSGSSGAAQTDIALVLDASGSMRRTDPGNLRLRAAHLFTTLLGPSNRLAVLGFADSPEQLHGLTVLDGSARAASLAAIETVGADGRWTDITAALEAALAEFDLTVPGRRCVVLLTDGAIDLPGGATANAGSLQRLQSRVLAACLAGQVTVHTVAFSDESAHGVLGGIARATQGQHRLVTDASQLHQVFADLFETVDSPQMAPIDGDTVTIDSTVRDATFLISHAEQTDASVQLVSPAGDVLTREEVEGRRGVRWMTTPEFDLITVENPASGEWRIAPVSGHDRVVLVTDLTLESSPLPRHVERGNPLSIQAWLAHGGRPISEEAITSTTDWRVLVADESGLSEELTMRDDGESDDFEGGDFVFGAVHAGLRQAGTHRFTVQARGATFARQRTFLVTASENWLRLRTDPSHPLAGQPVVLEAEVLASAPPHSGLRIRVGIAAEGVSREEVELLAVSDRLFASQWHGFSAPGPHVLQAVAEARGPDGSPIALAAPPLLLEVTQAVEQAPTPGPEETRPIETIPEPASAAMATAAEPLSPDEIVVAAEASPAALGATAVAVDAAGGNTWARALACLVAAVLVVGVYQLMPRLRRRAPGLSARDRLNMEIEAIAMSVESQLKASPLPTAEEPVSTPPEGAHPESADFSPPASEVTPPGTESSSPEPAPETEVSDPSGAMEPTADADEKPLGDP